MEIEKPIPSYAILDGRKVKIYHPGQRRTCARCQKTSDQCNGQSNAKLCEENGGLKVNLETVWGETLKSVGYKEWSGGEIHTLGEKQASDEPKEPPKKDDKEELSTRYPNCDGIIISNLPEDITSDEIEKILNTAVLNSAEGVSILQEESSRSRLIKNIALESVLDIVNKIDNKNIKGKVIHCRPHVPSTPPTKTVTKDAVAFDAVAFDAVVSDAVASDVVASDAVASDAVASSGAEDAANKDKQQELERSDKAVTPTIPGLPEKERKKTLKNLKKKEKKQAGKE